MDAEAVEPGAADDVALDEDAVARDVADDVAVDEDAVARDAADDVAVDEDALARDEADDVAVVRAADKARRDRGMVAQGRRIGGVPGAALAGAMIAMRDIYEGPKRDDGVVVVEAPSEPHDVDRDGVALTRDAIGGALDVTAPAQPRLPPVMTQRRRSRRRS